METTTSLCAWGTSRAVRIPKKMCEEADMQIGAVLSMQCARDERGPYIVIRPQEREHRRVDGVPFLSLDDAFAGYSGGYAAHEFDWGDDVGAEVIR